MQITEVDIETLIPDPNNANTHDDKNLAAIRGSIKKFDVVEPLIVRRQNNIVIGGNGRLTVLKELGHKTVPVHYVDFDDQKAKALAIALNQTASLSSFDMEILGGQLQELYEGDFDIGEIGFDVSDIGSNEEHDEPKERRVKKPKSIECPNCESIFTI